MHRFTNRFRAIIENLQRDTGRDLRAERGEQLPDFVDHFDSVDTGLTLDRENNAAGVIEPTGNLVVLYAIDHTTDFFQSDRAALPVSDNERPIIGSFH